MDFRFTPEQEMAADVVRKLLNGRCQSADLRRLMSSGDTRDETRWSSIAELGMAGALVPEQTGGLGLGAADFVLAAEAAGYVCLPEPLVENTGVALPLLAAVAPQSTILTAALDGLQTVAVGHPANPLVADADTASALLLEHQGALHLVLPDDVKMEHQPSADPFRRLFSVKFVPDASSQVASGDAAAAALQTALDRGALFSAAQMLGIAQRCVDLGVAYTRERKQFGKPIGSYQAVKHHLATAQVKIEFARPVVYAAAAGLHAHDIHSRARISQAKLAASEAADNAARASIQVHGAMGYSWEVDVHFYLKRALALESWWGTPAFHRNRVAERVFNAPLGPDQTFATETPNG